ncbi:hypothetical protein SNE40_009013 [Patella caerulea]|uniref:Kazal-like domain-containing protein n=1 Tax=Patella caerulea TaxID=87958 RepID=A0AAN8PPJ4_PATCE
MSRIFLLVLFLTGCSAQKIDFTKICSYVNRIDCGGFLKSVICATNSKTYDTECAFAKAHCNDTDLHIAHYGDCIPDKTPIATVHGTTASYLFFCRNLKHSHCGTDVEVVCGSDGITYNNLCLFEKARCSQRDLIVAKYDRC